MSNQPLQLDPWYIRLIKFLGPYLLSAGGLAGGYEIAPKITQNPVWQLVIALVAGLLAYALSFINKVWQKLEGPLVDKTAAWLPAFLNNRFAGYHRQYLYYLSHAHRVLEFNGLAQRPAYNRELERIFVKLDMVPIAPHLASPHMLKSPLCSPSDSQGIWYYLSDKTHTSGTFVILGPAGNGKTTLLKYITCSLTRTRSRLQLRRKHHLSHLLPVLLYIREQIATIRNKPESTLPELLQSHVQNKGRLTIPGQWFEQQFKRGKCLIMLDGLDEVPDREERKQIIEWVRKQILAYPNNRFILTSRPHGYDTYLDDALVLNVQPFTLTQIKSFVHKWYLIDEFISASGKYISGVQIRANEKASNLLMRLNLKSSLRELAANPLLLTMITLLYSNGSSLPNNRLDLYREIFQVLLYRRRDAIGLTPKLNVQQKLEVLQPLASHMLQRHLLEIEYDQLSRVITRHLARVASEITPADFLKDIEQNSGLFLEISRGTWGFAHKTLQEYLAATYLKERRKGESILLNHISDDCWWHETICFYCAQADASKIIQSCLVQADTSLPILNLALECNDQKLKADPIVTQQIEELLQTGIEATNPKKRQIVAEALLKRRLESMVYLHDNVYMDTSLVSCAEYQLFLDDQSVQGRHYHPWHWTSDTFQTGHTPILGVQPSDIQAFCEWLTTRENGLWSYRLLHKDELAQILAHLEKKEQSQPVGFWVEENEFAWLSGAAPEYENLGDMVLDQLLLDRAQALAYDHVHARDLKDAIDEMLELERKLNDEQAPDISQLLVQNIRVRPLDFNRYDPIFMGNTSTRPIKKTMLADRFFASVDSKGHSFSSLMQETKQRCRLIRYQSQLQARRDYHYAELGHANKPQKQQRLLEGQDLQLKSLLQQSFESSRRECIDFTLLELRTQGKLPPWEGILLVKEHKMEV